MKLYYAITKGQGSTPLLVLKNVSFYPVKSFMVYVVHTTNLIRVG